MGVITIVEDSILAEAKDALGNTVREVSSLPGGWTLDMLKRALQFAPGVYVAFIGAGEGAVTNHYIGRFMVYTVTRGPVEAGRRRGSGPVVIGAYDMIEALVPRLDSLPVTGVGTLRVKGIDNVFSEAAFDLGGSVYGIQLRLSDMPFELTAYPATLDDFVTFDARYHLDKTQDGNPIAEDTVTGLNTL